LRKFHEKETDGEMVKARVALVTGGSRGIGREICLAFAREGMSVVLSYNSSPSSAEEARSEMEKAGGKALIVKADVCDESNMVALVSQTIERFGSLDVLVNCAGILALDPIETMTLQAWHKVMDTNLTSCFLAIREAVPYLKKSPCPRIINIASQAAFTGTSQRAHYAASKAGMLGLTYSLAKELGPFGITVNTVSPGRVDTEILAYGSAEKRKEWLSVTPLNRFGTTSEIASAVTYLASETAGYITGANLNVNGGMLMG